MMNKVDNVEDAKTVIKNAPDCEYFKYRVKVNILRALVFVVIAAVLAAIFGIVSNSLIKGIIIFICNEIIVFPAVLPYIILKKATKYARDDDYLNKKFDEQELIDMANEHIDQVNEYEMKKDEPSEWGY